MTLLAASLDTPSLALLWAINRYDNDLYVPVITESRGVYEIAYGIIGLGVGLTTKTCEYFNWIEKKPALITSEITIYCGLADIAVGGMHIVELPTLTLKGSYKIITSCCRYSPKDQKLD